MNVNKRLVLNQNLNTQNGYVFVALVFSLFFLNPSVSSASSVNDRSFNFREAPPEPLLSGLDYKVINSLSSAVFTGNEENFFLEGRSGLSLKAGVNFLLFEDGYLYFGRKVLFYFQAKQIQNSEGLKNSLLRFYSKINFGKFSLLAGKENFNMGHGEYGLLISDNAEPYPLLKLQTEKPVELFGEWHFLLFNGWLTESREDVSNPQILGIRVSYKPWSYVQFGVSKTELFGGDGRPGYTLPEYWKLLTGSEDNVQGKFDNDGNASWDIALYIPLSRWNRDITLFKLFYQRAGTDIIAGWQKEDRGEFSFPLQFKLLRVSRQSGALLVTKADSYRIEYASTSDVSFTHHFYSVEGQTFKGLSIGYPYGRDIQSLFFKYTHNYAGSSAASIGYTLGALEKPTSSKTFKMRRYYFSVEGNGHCGEVKYGWYLRADQTNNYNKNPVPSQKAVLENVNRFFYTIGLSVSITL